MVSDPYIRTTGLVRHWFPLTACISLFLCYTMLDFKSRQCYKAPDFRDSSDENFVTFRTLFSDNQSKNHSNYQVRRRLSSHRYRRFRILADYKRDLTKDSNYQEESSKNLTWNRRLPQAIIIGVKKGGTRALLEFLRIHPDVRAPGPEPHFFDRNYHRGLNWYRNEMPPTLSSQITIEKTPSYFVTPEVPPRIRTMSGEVKLIVVVRDPVTRAISDYTQAVSKRRDTKSFEDMAFLNATTGLVDTSWSAIKIGIYVHHLERWLKYFPLDRMHFVSGERLISDPVKEVERVQKFLGLKAFIGKEHFYFNETKGFPCLRKSQGTSNPHCLGKTKGRVHPYIHTSTILRLRNFFSPFNQMFYRLTKQNFKWP